MVMMPGTVRVDEKRNRVGKKTGQVYVLLKHANLGLP